MVAKQNGDSGDGRSSALPVVLVVASDRVVCDVVTTALEDRCAVMAATTMRAAHEVIAVRAPRVVVIDADLPVAGRGALFDDIKSRNPNVQFVIVEPAKRGASLGESLLPPGATLSRPIHPGQISEAVSQALGEAPDDVEKLLLRVHRSRTTSFER